MFNLVGFEPGSAVPQANAMTTLPRRQGCALHPVKVELIIEKVHIDIQDIRGLCCDHNFPRFSTIFGKKMTNVMIKLFLNLAFLNIKRQIFRHFFPNFFLNHSIGPRCRRFWLTECEQSHTHLPLSASLDILKWQICHSDLG
jgi:hypothetical protein